MKVLYAKTLLYSYVHLNDVADQIDGLVEKRALFSMNNYAPALSQFEAIIHLTFEKDIVYAVKLICDKVFKKFSREDMKYFRYKYFKDMPKEEVDLFDTCSRTYFRKQNKLVVLFADRLEKCGIDDDFFEKNCMQIDFFKQLVKRAEEHETLNKKNKSKKPKLLLEA